VNRAAAQYARRDILRHPAVQSVGPLEEGGDGLRLWVDLDLGFGHKWLAEGASPGGVRPVERVRFEFGPDYPGVAPEPSYRADLGRAFAHVQPWLTADRLPVPCLTEAPIDDFHAAFGMAGLVDQFVTWLSRAAAGVLIDPEQGWERSRRDSYDDVVVVDASVLRALPDDGRLGSVGYAYLQTRFGDLALPGGPPRHWLGEADLPVRLADAEIWASTQGRMTWGRGVAVAVWATANGEEPPLTVDVYAPDDVDTWGTLSGKAAEYHVSRRLQFALGLLTAHKPSRSERAVLPVVVFLLVRRPILLAGLDSPVEIFAYRIQLPFGGKVPRLDHAMPVRRLLVRDQVSTALLRQMSGKPGHRASWALIGAGSLGSKIGLHLAREGAPPIAVADKAGLAPHNLARHALTPSNLPLGLGWAAYKSTALADAIEAVTRQAVESLPVEAAVAIAALTEPSVAPEIIVNTTASLAVRASAALSSAGGPRWIDGELFDGAAVGVLRTEGPGRNPGIEELAGTAYVLARAEAAVGAHVFDGRLETVTLGEGCGSATMVADDARLSLLASSMAEALSDHLAALPEVGLVETWRREGRGVVYSRAPVGAFTRVPLEEGWTLSVSDRVQQALSADIARWSRVETGGVLMGRVSLVNRVIYALEVIAAPPDSRRSPNYFELGIEGLDDAISAWARETAGALYCVGTWHSHLGPATPSGVDRTTAGRLGAHSPYPLALLIQGRDGYKGVLAALGKETP
jgi:DNA-binding transcriptional ArsR family regulator